MVPRNVFNIVIYDEKASFLDHWSRVKITREEKDYIVDVSYDISYRWYLIKMIGLEAKQLLT